jgi:hypothetical protein
MSLRSRQRTGKHCALIMGVGALVVFAAMQITQAQKKGPTELKSSMAVTGADVQSLNGRLQGFQRQLSDQELGAIKVLLWRAAKAPVDDPSGVDITGSFFDLGSPIAKAAGGGIYTVAQGTAGSVPRKKIGGAGGQPPAPGPLARGEDEPNRPPPPQPRLEVLSASLGVGDSSVGRDGPPPPPPDVIKALEAKLVGLGNQLSLHERGIMNWLFQRAAGNASRGSSSEAVPRPTPGGPQPALTQALGIAAFGSRPGVNSSNGWVLRF